MSAHPYKRANLLATIRGSNCWKGKWLSACYKLVFVPLPWVFYTDVTTLKSVCLYSVFCQH